jgi:hypothetical protein
MLRGITGWPDIDMCFWIHLLSMVEIPVTHLISFLKIILKRHTDNSLEVHEK